MTTFMVCPIDGCVPPDNGTNSANLSPVVSDTVQAGSTIISSASGTVLNVATGANFSVGEWVMHLLSGEKMPIVSKNVNALTVIRGGGPAPAVPYQTVTTPSATIAQSDVIVTGMDANGRNLPCPLCGSRMRHYNAATVTTVTGVASGSQHPPDVDKTYLVQTDSPEAQTGTAWSRTDTGAAVVTRGFNTSPGYWSGIAKDTGEPTTWNTASGSVNRGAANVTPETINSTVGP